MHERASAERQTEEVGNSEHMAHLLAVLEHHKVPEAEIRTIRGILEGGRARLVNLKRNVQDANARMSIALVDILDAVGYFGPKDAPLEYDTRSSYINRLAVSNIGTGYGFFSAMAIVASLRDSETRRSVKALMDNALERLRSRRT